MKKYSKEVLFVEEAKGILGSSTGLLRTYNWEELDQFLRRYLIEGLHLSQLSLRRIFGIWLVEVSWKLFMSSIL